MCMFWASPCLNSLTCCSCDEDMFFGRLRNLCLLFLPSRKAETNKNLPSRMWFEQAIIFLLFVFFSSLLYSYTILLFHTALFPPYITQYSLSLIHHHSFVLSHLPNTPFPYPSSLQSASYPRRVASSFPVSS